MQSKSAMVEPCKNAGIEGRKRRIEKEGKLFMQGQKQFRQGA